MILPKVYAGNSKSAPLEKSKKAPSYSYLLFQNAHVHARLDWAIAKSTSKMLFRWFTADVSSAVRFIPTLKQRVQNNVLYSWMYFTRPHPTIYVVLYHNPNPMELAINFPKYDILSPNNCYNISEHMIF